MIDNEQNEDGGTKGPQSDIPAVKILHQRKMMIEDNEQNKDGCTKGPQSDIPAV